MGSPQAMEPKDWRSNLGVWCAVGDEESVSGMDAARQAPRDGFTASLSSPYRAARSNLETLRPNPARSSTELIPQIHERCAFE
jgi:hypothetical protein